jgi:DNA-binding response OmpR family regulator
LVADDNRDAADTLAHLVRLWGHDTRVAYDGTSALDLTLRYRPEVALLDVAMPGCNGNRLAVQLRARPGLRGALLMAVSGFPDEAHRRRSLEAGFDRYLVKPVEPGCLEELLTLRLEARRLRAALRRARGHNRELRRQCGGLLRQAMRGVDGLREQLRRAWEALQPPDAGRPPPGYTH